MTKLKVFNSQTNITYYLNNVDVSCAKLHSYIGETKNNDIIVHKPSPYLEYSIENPHEDIVSRLNKLYNTPIPSNYKGYFPESTGIIISVMFTEPDSPLSLKYTPYMIDCNNITNDETTYWCPPVIKRSNRGGTSSTIQFSRVSSFSYIHNMLLSSVYTHDALFVQFMIYDNTRPFNLLPDKLFAMYPGDARSEMCVPNYYCPSGGIGVCINTDPNYRQNYCLQDCSWDAQNQATACNNYNSFIDSIKEGHTNHKYGATSNYNELVIKSWNYNPDSSMSDRGIIQNDGSWIAQIPNPQYPWGWNDVSSLSSNENIPLLAFGVIVPDRTTIFGNNIKDINKMYIELSNNLEPSFNAYRSENDISSMPYRIGLDISCLTQQDCSNPFFDLADVLPPPCNDKYTCHLEYMGSLQDAISRGDTTANIFDLSIIQRGGGVDNMFCPYAYDTSSAAVQDFNLHACKKAYSQMPGNDNAWTWNSYKTSYKHLPPPPGIPPWDSPVTCDTASGCKLVRESYLPGNIPLAWNNYNYVDMSTCKNGVYWRGVHTDGTIQLLDQSCVPSSSS